MRHPKYATLGNHRTEVEYRKNTLHDQAIEMLYKLPVILHRQLELVRLQLLLFVSCII
nr:MAG TPA: hypothetical protein [Caudoviricetes sp.]